MKELSYFLIVNGASNSGRSLHTIKKHLSLIKKTLKSVQIYEISEFESISEIAASNAETFDVIVACGGDGTARKVAIGIKDHDVLFGILPLGSGNDFAKMLNLSSSFTENLNVLKKANHRSLDLGVFNSSYFINTLGIGFDGFTNFLASQSRIKGSLKYVISGLKALIIAQAFDTSIHNEGKKRLFKTKMIIIANGKWEGGKYLVSPTSINNDGLLDFIVLNNINRFRLAIEFIKLSLGKPLSFSLIEKISFKKAVIKTSIPVFVHADGEVEKKQSSFLVTINPKMFNVIYKSI